QARPRERPSREARVEAGEEGCPRSSAAAHGRRGRVVGRRPHAGATLVTRFHGVGQGASESLGYEEALNALLALVGRRVLVLFSGADGSPFIAGIVSGRLDRGEMDDRLQEVLLRDDATAVETLVFHDGTRESGFVVRPDEFSGARWEGRQLTLQLGHCAVTVLVQGELGEALAR